MNSLFISFLQQLEHEAKQKHSDHLAQNYRKALKSLQKYPHPVWTGTEAMAVPGIGPKIANKLNDMLIKHTQLPSSYQDVLSKNNTQTSQTTIGKLPKRKKQQLQCEKPNHDQTLPSEDRTVNTNTKKSYIPKPRSGPWALLVALYRASLSSPNFHGSLSKAELIHLAQPLCDSSFFQQRDSYYTAWNSMSTLIKKGYVMKSGRPVRYSLTCAGAELAKSLDTSFTQSHSEIVSQSHFANHITLPTQSDSFLSLNEQQQPSATTKTKTKTEITSFENYLHFLLSRREWSCHCPKEQKNYDVILNDDTTLITHRILQVRLVIDNRERKNNKDPSYILNQLIALECPCEVRKLELGDMIWIGITDTGYELVLPYVVERKVVADLCSSIIDGRYKEQKFRLSQCGLQNVIYLVEGDVLSFFCNNYSKGVTKEAFETALAKTQLHDNFFLKQTKTTQDTIQYLHTLTQVLQIQYTTQCTEYCTTTTTTTRNEELLRRKQRFSLCIRDRANRELLLTFEQYNELNAKNNLTVTDIFAKQIIVLRGGSVDKALTVTKEYPTPFSLIQKYKSLSREEQKQNLFKNTICLQSGRRLGPSFSKVLYKMFCTNDPHTNIVSPSKKKSTESNELFTN